MTEIAAALQDIASTLDTLEVPFAVIGGIAVRTYGIPRPTFDIDFVLTISRDRMEQLIEELEQQGHTVLEAYRSGWVDTVAGMPLVKVQCQVLGKGVDIDMFLAETKFQQSLMKRRKLLSTPDGPTWLASPEDVVLLKLLAHRPRDLSDVGDILFAQGDLDRDYLSKWAISLGIEDRLQDSLSQYDEMT